MATAVAAAPSASGLTIGADSIFPSPNGPQHASQNASQHASQLAAVAAAAAETARSSGQALGPADPPAVRGTPPTTSAISPLGLPPATAPGAILPPPPPPSRTAPAAPRSAPPMPPKALLASVARTASAKLAETERLLSELPVNAETVETVRSYVNLMNDTLSLLGRIGPCL